jgi:2-polyprenyl-6-methoxyphenol hydroxylase-like FAD-dependent oxidoreductase
MTNIGIVGTGIAGLHLGLFLQQHGVSATIYADRTPDEQRAGRILNNVVRFEHTRSRERTLGVNHWDAIGPGVESIGVWVGGEHPLAFTGRLSQPASYVDMRLYQATLLEDFAARGGHVAFGTMQAEDLVRLSERHDLLVVASGRGSLVELFPRVAEHSPYDRPQRLLSLGFYTGIAADPRDVAFVIAPGQGEVFQTTTYSFHGNQTAVLFEAIPGGAFETLARMRYEDDPQRFAATALDLLREYAPPIYARIDPTAFGLTRPLDLLQGAITPTVRQGYVRLDNGAFAMAIGDVQVVNDPLIAQGANTASRSAWTLGEAILEGGMFDEGFCRRAAERIWAYAQGVTEWSNFMLQPPPSHIIDMLVAASQHQAVADAFADGFTNPLPTWELLRSPERVAGFLDRSGTHTRGET